MLKIGKKVCRTLQEQVFFNAYCIDKIREYINGIDAESHLIVLTSSSGTLTSEKLAIAKLPTAYIVVGDKVYIKSDESSHIRFVSPLISVSAKLGGGYSVSEESIEVNEISGAYNSVTISLIDTYSQDELDTELAKFAELSGADFTGGIKAPSIIELMDGYAFTKISSAGTLIYAGVVKTGNKITFVVYGKYEAGETVLANDVIGAFTIPESVGQKLYPQTINGNPVLDLKEVTVFQGINPALNEKFNVYATKASDQTINIAQYGGSSLTLTYDSLYRYEATFLLSDNLAS